MISTEVVKKLEENRERRLNNDVVAIPYSFERLSTYLPGIEQSKYYCVTGAQKSGKTQVADFLFVFSVVDWYIKNKHTTNIKPKIIYFSLEVSRELKILSAISYKLFQDYKIIISPQKLRSVFQNYILDETILSIIKSPEFTAWLKEFEDIVEIHESVRNPTGIYKTVKAYAESHGKYEHEDIPWQNDDGSYTTRRVIKRYIPNNPDEFVIIINDNTNLLQPESGGSLAEAMHLYSSRYCLEFRDRFKYIPVDIQQQSGDSQSSAFDFRGDLVVNKVKPDPWGLGDNKRTARNFNLMMGIFYPWYYEIPSYNGINLERIGDNHRELSILLNRDGLSNLSIDLMFLGAANHFRELPREINDNVYKVIKKYTDNEV